MMLKVGSEFLEFDEDVELERQALLFEELSETRGDFSYSFNIPRTHKNCGILGQPFPDNASKPVYTRIDCQLMSDSGTVLHIGFLRIEQITKRFIVTSFFSGNSNWLSLMTGDMTELDLTQYDRAMTLAEIQGSWLNDSGIVFPLIDTGTLISRSHEDLLIEDFVGCFYLHTLMKEVFQQAGLKLQGELLKDAFYNKIVVATNTRSKTDVDRNSIYAGKNNNQVIPIGSIVTDITFNLHSSPYSTGSDVTFTSDIEYIALSDMLVDISFSAVGTGLSTGFLVYSVKVDGEIVRPGGSGYFENGGINLESVKVRAGEIIKVTAFNQSADPVTITKATLRIVPKFIYKAFGRSSVPLWTQFEFVSNVLQLFNTVTDYDPYSKTVTINLFDKIKSKPPIDLSQYIDDSEQNIDYVEFISNYGKNTTLRYETSDDDTIQEYNISSFVKYGEGVIEIENEMLPESASIVDSDFSAPISYLNGVFDASLEKINFVELDEVLSEDTTSITNSGGFPRFNITDADDFFSVYDLVRIESSNTNYSGDYQVAVVTSTYIQVVGLSYDGAADATVSLMRHNVTTDDSVYLFVHAPDTPVPDISPTKDNYYMEFGAISDIGIGFFNLLNNGTQVNTDFKQGLAFGEITDPLFYQRTMIQTYWSTAARVLNDPVKLVIRAYLPESVYNQLTPLVPIFIKTNETVNLYYVNRITGFYPCQIELIKLP